MAWVSRLGNNQDLNFWLTVLIGWFNNLIDVEGNRFGLYELAPNMKSGPAQ